jgi:hypothetical protein
MLSSVKKLAIEEIVGAVAALDAGDNPGADDERAGLEKLAKELIASTFPPGCTWDCYFRGNPDLAAAVEGMEEGALMRWVAAGNHDSRDCSCKEGGDAAEGAELAVKVGAPGVNEGAVDAEEQLEAPEGADAGTDTGTVQEEPENVENDIDEPEKLDDDAVGQEETLNDDVFLEGSDTGTLQEELENIEDKMKELEDLDDDSAEQEEETLYGIEADLLEEAIDEALDTIDEDIDALKGRDDATAEHEKDALYELALELGEEVIKEATGDEDALDLSEEITDVEQQLSNLEEFDQGIGEDAVPEDREHSEEQADGTIQEEEVSGEVEEQLVLEELEEINEEIEEIEFMNDAEKGKGELMDELYGNLTKVEEEIDQLEGSDEDAVEQEKEELYELEDELMEELIGEEQMELEDDEFEELEYDDMDDLYEDENDDEFDLTEGGDILGEDYERPEDIKESIEEIEKEIAGALLSLL